MRRFVNERSAIGLPIVTMMAVLAASVPFSACASASASGGQEGGAVEMPEPAETLEAETAETGAMTVLDGVYTEDQANRGDDLAQSNCMACHSPGEWSNGRYIGLWDGRSVAELFDNLEGTMPYDEPGRLTRQEYSDIIAYIFRLGDLPAGDVPLPSDADGLAQIQVVRPGG
jgi:mono/diheme cytochrome c family protein